MNFEITSSRAASFLVVAAVIYSIVPMVLNASGRFPWIAVPPLGTLVVYQAVAIASALQGARRFHERRWTRFALWAVSTAIWTGLIYLTLTYRPGGSQG